MVNNELRHHGIKGMKWGIRRSEAQLARARGKETSSDDGSDGKKSKGVLGKAFEQNIKGGKDKPPISAAEKIGRESEKIIDNSIKISNEISKARKKNGDTGVNTMTTEELKSAIERMRLEDAYNELSRKRIENGRKTVADVLTIAGGVVGIASSTVGIASTIKTLKG